MAALIDALKKFFHRHQWVYEWENCQGTSYYHCATCPAEGFRLWSRGGFPVERAK